MHNLDTIVRMYFDRVPANGILTNRIPFDRFPLREFAQSAKAHMTSYSDTEIRQLYAYIQDGGQEEGHPFAGMYNRSGLNVFAALEELSEQLLTMENNKVKCIYRSLLRFREVSQSVDEDLLVCAYLAMQGCRYGKRFVDFGWNTVIGHNNVQLNRIMERGLSENHFHLYGSAPSFHLLWVHFMNHVADQGLYRFAKELEERQRTTREHYNVRYEEDSFVVRILKAALIRVQMVLSFLDRRAGVPKPPDPWMTGCLNGSLKIEAYRGKIQMLIDRIRNYALISGMGELSDYALCVVKGLQSARAEQYWFAGERWLIHEMLQQELTGDCGGNRYRILHQWFYAYLVLKQNVRCELVSVNSTVGFENFLIYSRRKGKFIHLDKMVETAVYGSVDSGNIRSLEMRISPGRSAYENAKMIRDIDSVIQRRRPSFPKSGCYYVLHFGKRADEVPGQWQDFNHRCCRHYKKRQQLRQQADAICSFREQYRRSAARVLGIDACSQEIGCRAEVFAPVFRRLSNHVVSRAAGIEEQEVGQLKMTYHVGEDFLDVADGLRAVDEAIHFLNLQCGDRIGHGTVLGIDAGKWYCQKGNTIVLPKQDYLDNVVWLYHKLSEYGISGMENLREFLREEFAFYFNDIYLSYEDGQRRGKIGNTEQDKNWAGYIDIYIYYEAWKLRGDEPELYLRGIYDHDQKHGREWLVNREYPENHVSRMRAEIAGLYYMYHYDWHVRKKGQKSLQIHVPAVYVEGVQAVQRGMRRAVATLGLGVETNPSSNFAISTMERYEEHPIVVMYNKDLTWDIKQLQDCPQINVSINTDDKGVFHTSLENEYALMACALEKAKDECGNALYNRQMICQWIDNIREMGNQQSFGERQGTEGTAG